MACPPIKKEALFHYLPGFFLQSLKHPLLILFISLGIAAVTLPGILRLDIGVNMEDYFLEDDPVLKSQEKYQRLFPKNRFIGVLVQGEDVFSRESLELIKKLGDRLFEEVPFAAKVRSIVHSETPLALETELNFYKDTLLSPNEEIRAFKRECNQNLVIKGRLFSRDNREAWIQLQLNHFSRDGDAYQEIAAPKKEDYQADPQFYVGKKVYDIVRSLDNPEDDIRLTAAGVPVFAYLKETEMMQDLMKVLLIASIVAAVLSVIIIRCIRGVLGTLLVILLSVVSVLGVEGWMGTKVDSAFLSVPVLLVIGVSIGYTVHIHRFYKIYYRDGLNRRAAALCALSKTAKPVLFTALTTIAGLMAFLLVEIKPIRWLGVTSAVSILAVFIFSLTLFPAILSLGKSKGISVESMNEQVQKRKYPFRKHQLQKDLLNNALMWITRILIKRSKTLVALFVILVISAVPGILRITVDFDAEQMMGLRLPHMKDQALIGSSSIASSETMDLIISIPRGSFLEPENLQALTVLEKKIHELPLVQGTASLAGIIRDMNYTLHRRDMNYLRVPEKKSHIRYVINALKSTDRNLYNSWIAGDAGTTRLFIEFREFSSLTIKENMRKIETMAAALFPGGTDYFFGGPTYQMAVMNQYVTKGLIRSLLTALIIIALFMIILFKSIRTGLIAMVPNVFPVLIIGAVMGYFNLPLEFVTMTVAPMIMGLAVDDTIHLLSHLRDEYDSTGDFSGSIQTTFSIVGSAISKTTFILCFTFSVFFFSRINSIRVMGLLVCIGLVSAYLADLFITPVLLGKLEKER